MVNATAGLIGVVLLVRHGDRTEYYQDPSTYNSTQAYLTPLGAVSVCCGLTLRLSHGHLETRIRTRMLPSQHIPRSLFAIFHPEHQH